jgi:hypothetical protein
MRIALSLPSALETASVNSIGNRVLRRREWSPIPSFELEFPGLPWPPVQPS